MEIGIVKKRAWCVLSNENSKRFVPPVQKYCYLQSGQISETANRTKKKRKHEKTGRSDEVEPDSGRGSDDLSDSDLEVCQVLEETALC